MKLPQTADELKIQILVSSDKVNEVGNLRIRQLISLLNNVSPEIIIEGVIRVFETQNRADKLYQDQELAGQILTTINPKSQKDLKEILERTLPTWEESIEQLPFWLRENYGIEKVRTIFETIELPNQEMKKLETMKFWMSKSL